jgi:hypothetical protein
LEDHFQNQTLLEMNKDLLAKIKKLVGDSRYRIKIHAVKHMIEEGFSEKDVITAILGESKIIEISDEDKRCLILETVTIKNQKSCLT